MKNKQQEVAIESVKREGDKEERDYEKEGEENSLVSDLSLSDSEDENNENCAWQDEKTDGNAKNDAANSKKGEAWEDDGGWRSTVDKLRSIVKVRLHICKGYLRESYPARAQSARARRACALRALGLLLADRTPTVGGGKTF